MEEIPYSCPLKGGRYENPHSRDQKRGLWDALLWQFGYYDDPEPLPVAPDHFTYPAQPKPYEQGKPYAVWAGHSSYLVECGGLTLLTDPVWNDYCSPVPIKALKRFAEVPFPLTALPRLDVVLLSHNHYDHLDESTVCELAFLQPQITWIVAKGMKQWFRRRRIDAVIELDWWQKTTIRNHTITAVPTQHFSGRSLWDKNKTLWNGYVVESNERKLYFVGDTGYNPIDFKAIGRKFGPIDLSLIPIGTYVPKEFMAPVHSSPFDAVEIHIDVKSRFSLGMHWKTFRLSGEPMGRPPYDLYRAMSQKNLDCATFLPVDIGTYVNW